MKGIIDVSKQRIWMRPTLISCKEMNHGLTLQKLTQEVWIRHPLAYVGDSTVSNVFIVKLLLQAFSRVSDVVSDLDSVISFEVPCIS